MQLQCRKLDGAFWEQIFKIAYRKRRYFNEEEGIPCTTSKKVSNNVVTFDCTMQDKKNYFPDFSPLIVL